MALFRSTGGNIGGRGLLGFLIVGLIAGYIAKKETGSNHGHLTKLVIGMIGALVGATLGAIGCLCLWRSIRG